MVRRIADISRSSAAGGALARRSRGGALSGALGACLRLRLRGTLRFPFAADDGDRRAYGDGLAFMDEDLGQDAPFVGRDLDCCFFRLDLGDRLLLLNVL